MTGWDTPEFDELGPDGLPSNGLSFDGPPADDLSPGDPLSGGSPPDLPNRFEVETAAESGTAGPESPTGKPPRGRRIGRAPSTNGHRRPGRTPERFYGPSVWRARAAASVKGSGPDSDLTAVLTAAAAAAADEEEAALLAAALVGSALVATTLVATPQTPGDLRPALPALVKGIAGLAMWLVEEEAYDLIHLLPLILDGTARALGRAAAEGRPITRDLAGDTLARQTEKIISAHVGRANGHGRRDRRVRRATPQEKPSHEDDCGC